MSSKATAQSDAVEFLRRVIANSQKIALGPRPWTADELRQAYFRNFVATRTAVDATPGGKIAQHQKDLSLSEEFLRHATEILERECAQYRKDASDEGLSPQSGHVREESAMLRVRYAVFGTCCSAVALAEHSSTVRARLKFSKNAYDERGAQVWGHDYAFIRTLRNMSSHVRVSPTHWLKRFDKHGTHLTFYLDSVDLKQSALWKDGAKAFLELAGAQINIEQILIAHARSVTAFQDWFRREIEMRHADELSEYREYVRVLDSIAAWSHWNLVINTARQWNVNPYVHLNNYLAPGDIAEVLSLPDRSRRQIDRIIEIVDVHRACDEKLRQDVYRLFGVDEPS
jgi:hypothetical protein